MENDWRTDNWAGHYPVHIDPRNYHFARHLREFNHYAQYNFEGASGLEQSETGSIVKMFLFMLIGFTILANLHYIIDILTHFQTYYTMWVDSVLDIKQTLHK